MSKKVSRDDLISLAKRIQDAQDQGEDYSVLLSQLQAHLPYPNVRELFLGDYSADYIVDFALNWQVKWPKLSKEEMINLVTKLINAEGTQAELALMTLQFDANCIHPAKNGLIYYPDEYFENSPDPSPSEIVEKALSTE